MNCDKLGHIAPVCRQPKQSGTNQKHSAASNAVTGSYKSVTGLVGSITATQNHDYYQEMVDMLSWEDIAAIESNTDNQSYQELEDLFTQEDLHPKEPKTLYATSNVNSVTPKLQPLDTVSFIVTFLTPNAKPFKIHILPDTGANVTALDISHARGIPLQHTNITLRLADSSPLNTLGTINATISRHGITIQETIYIMKGLAGPLLSR